MTVKGMACGLVCLGVGDAMTEKKPENKPEQLDAVKRLVDAAAAKKADDEQKAKARAEIAQQRHQLVSDFNAATESATAKVNKILSDASAYMTAGGLFNRLNAVDAFKDKAFVDDKTKERLKPLSWISFYVPGKKDHGFVMILATDAQSMINALPSDHQRPALPKCYVYLGSSGQGNVSVDKLHSFDPATVDEDALRSLINEAFDKAQK